MKPQTQVAAGVVVAVGFLLLLLPRKTGDGAAASNLQTSEEAEKAIALSEQDAINFGYVFVEPDTQEHEQLALAHQNLSSFEYHLAELPGALHYLTANRIQWASIRTPDGFLYYVNPDS